MLFDAHSSAITPPCVILDSTMVVAIQDNFIRVYLFSCFEHHGAANTVAAHTSRKRNVLPLQPLPRKKCPGTTRSTTQTHARSWSLPGFIASLCKDPGTCVIVEVNKLVLAFFAHHCAMTPICATISICARTRIFPVISVLQDTRHRGQKHMRRWLQGPATVMT